MIKVNVPELHLLWVEPMRVVIDAGDSVGRDEMMLRFCIGDQPKKKEDTEIMRLYVLVW